MALISRHSAPRQDQRAQIKVIADYATGVASQVSAESAREAIQTARRLVDCIILLIRNGGAPQHG